MTKNVYVSDEIALNYHRRQWDHPNRSTVAFAQFLAPELAESKRVVDLGCGGGAATAFLATCNHAAIFHGIDYTDSLIKMAEEQARKRTLMNLRFSTADWYSLPSLGDVDGVVSVQTLGWMDDWKRAMSIVFGEMRPRWVGILSLFYDGDISCSINVTEHERDRNYSVHVIGLPALERVACEYGYTIARTNAFDIDIDIPRGDIAAMGTYTVATLANTAKKMRRLQISGPILMSWFNVMLVRVG